MLHLIRERLLQRAWLVRLTSFQLDGLFQHHPSNSKSLIMTKWLSIYGLCVCVFFFGWIYGVCVWIYIYCLHVIFAKNCLYVVIIYYERCFHTYLASIYSHAISSYAMSIPSLQQSWPSKGMATWDDLDGNFKKIK